MTPGPWQRQRDQMRWFSTLGAGSRGGSGVRGVLGVRNGLWNWEGLIHTRERRGSILIPEGKRKPDWGKCELWGDEHPEMKSGSEVSEPSQEGQCKVLTPPSHPPALFECQVFRHDGGQTQHPDHRVGTP